MSEIKKKIAVLTPVFNEENNIKQYFEKFSKIISQIKNYELEFVFTDNNSTDNTIEEIKKYTRSNFNIKIISLSKNFGRTASQYAGLENSKADLYFMIDVDCEDPPELLLEFIKKHEEQYDIVYGKRNRIKESFFLYLFAKLFYRIANILSDHDFVLDMAEFSLFPNKVKKEIMRTKTNFPFIRGELASVGFSKIGIDYLRYPRKYGVSKFKFLDLIYFAIGGILSTSTFFLRINAISGILILIINFCYLVLLIFNNFELATKSLIIILITNIFYVVFCLIFISIYVARIHKNLLQKPIYVIDEDRSFNL